MKNKKVKLLGHGVFWWLDYDNPLGSCLSPLDHCDEHGELITLRGDLAYAFVTRSGNILRFQEKIGTRADLEDVP